ncbi:hypothetical protein JCM10908_002182 [Rhodotorula pacifica]|uniref:uncharacterized protein n=1 Tax=Rhodotorula pacifica TaxID=1495444 RepID=UPI00318033C2
MLALPRAVRSCCCRRTLTTKSASPHPALTVLPDFLTTDEQSTLLRHSLRLLDSPSRTTSAGRKKRREWIRANSSWDARNGFMGDEAYDWEEAHFDSVIKQYREMLVREGMWDPPEGAEPLKDAKELDAALQKIYALLPPSPSSSLGSPSNEKPASPPSHLILHLLHLSSKGAIYPHVDNLEAFGRTIVGISLGGERVMRFKRVEGEADAKVADDSGPANFDVLLGPGSAYVQNEPLRTYYTHEVLETAEWDGRMFGGTQRLSIMLRDRLPIQE